MKIFGQLLCRAGIHKICAYPAQFDTYHSRYDEMCERCGAVRTITVTRLPESWNEARVTPWFPNAEELAEFKKTE